MSCRNLSKTEIILLIAAIGTVFVNINLIIFISYVLPLHWKRDGYVASSSDKNQLIKECECLRKADNQKQSWTDKIADFPFLVSLTLPLYSDWDVERKYICSGFIASSKKIITSRYSIFVVVF